MDAWGLEEQSYEYKTKPYEKDYGPFYRYDPDQCILCGRCVEACQDIEVNETISIDWNREHPRVIWDNDVLLMNHHVYRVVNVQLYVLVMP